MNKIFIKRALLIISSFFVIFFLIFSLIFNNYIDNREEYFKDFNISFSGIVEKKQEITGDIGIVKLYNVESSDSFYDPREDNKIYLCVIKDGMAEVIMNGLTFINKGDSIIVDSNIKKIFIYEGEKLKDNRSFYIPPNFLSFYDMVKKNHEL